MCVWPRGEDCRHRKARLCKVWHTVAAATVRVPERSLSMNAAYHTIKRFEFTYTPSL